MNPADSSRSAAHPALASAGDRNPFELLAEEFAERYRRGERPALSDYVARYPDLADEIRELFPALVLMERYRPSVADGSRFPGTRPAPDLPEQVGDYRILREIGRGGMGIVYEAEQVSLGRHVALKVLPVSGLTSQVALERFRLEAKAAARLHHTNIVPVFGVGEEAGIHYLAMQFIQGEALDKVLDDVVRIRGGATSIAAARSDTPPTDPPSPARGLWTGQFLANPAASGPANEHSTLIGGPSGSSATVLSRGGSEWEYYRGVARIGVQAADALGYAHRLGVLHRDIKPSNLLLDAQGTVWITDFGLAKAEGGDELTHTGDVVGTVRYMAPERFDSISLPQSDIYGLGLTLYEMLALRPAFQDGNCPRLIERILQTTPPRLRKLDSRIPRDLETIVQKAITRDPADRYGNADAMAEDLRRFLADRPIHARPTPATERLVRWCRRNKLVAGLLCSVLALLIVIAIGSTVAAWSLNALRNDALDKLWHAKLNEAIMLSRSHQPGQRFASLVSIREATEIARGLGWSETDRGRLRDAALAAIALPDLQSVDNLRSEAARKLLAADCALCRYAFVDQSGNVTIRSLGSDSEIASIPSQGPSPNVSLSPDGRYAAISLGGQENVGNLSVWRIDGDEPACIFHGLALATIWCDFTQDSRRYVFVDHRTFTVLDLETGAALPPRRLTGTHRGGVACSPDGLRVAISQMIGDKGVVEIRDLDTGAIRASLRVEHPVANLAWRPGGALLAVACEGHYIISIWDVAAQKLASTLEGHKNGGIELRFTHAGNHLISSDWSGVMRLWDMDSGRQVLSLNGSARYSIFSPEDRVLIGPCGTSAVPAISRFAPGRELRSLVKQAPGQPVEYMEPRFSRDGRMLAVATIPRGRAGTSGTTILTWPEGHPTASLLVPSLSPMALDDEQRLWTRGPGGLLRWPTVQSLQNGLSEPEVFETGAPDEGCSIHDMSADGRTVLFTSPIVDTVILHRENARLVPVGGQDDVRYGAISPDQHFVATGSHFCMSGKPAKVWDAATGALLHEFDVSNPCAVAFSPDNRWLVTRGGGIRLWQVGSWEEGPKVSLEGDASGLAFSPDGALLAIGGHGQVRLVRADNGKEIARLPIGESALCTPACFSPNGTQLLVHGQDTQSLHVWDLGAVQSELANLGLGWEISELSSMGLPANPADAHPTDLQSSEVELRPTIEVHAISETLALRAIVAALAKPWHAAPYFSLAQLVEGEHAVLAFGLTSVSLALEGNQPLARLRRAIAAAHLNAWAVALEDADIFLRNQPERIDVHFLRARALHELDRHAEAIAEFNRLEPRLTQSVRLHLHRAKSYDALGDLEHAAADRRQAVDLARKDPTTVNYLSWTFLTNHSTYRHPVEALELARLLIETAPDNSDYRNTLGVAEYRNGLYAQALRSFQKSLEKTKSEAHDLFFMAMCYRRLGDRRNASNCMNRALKWCRDNSDLEPAERAELQRFKEEAEICLNSPP
jgi:serine/threonine protein kinase/WD40 repeat protein/Flp pilus assembly protein TadD